ncbi:MAG TPA: SIMPL domain-containing protein [Candidatus Nanoarchaeia archaeon]|nr:SIMPL domain-containing protein [Candidatus Nanoarchaeia archaeon]
MKQGIIIAIIAAIVVLGLVAAGLAFYSSAPTVAAQGSASLKAVPDEVSVVLNVEVRNKTAVETQRQALLITEQLIEALEDRGIDKDDVQFSNINTYEDFEWSNGRQMSKGFITRQELIVKTDEFKQVARIVGAAAETGVLVQYINFELSQEKQNEYKAQALEMASADARTKAMAIAAGQGKELGKLVKLTNNEFYYPGPYVAYAKSAEDGVASTVAAERAAAQLSPKELEVTASVSAEYKLR